MKTSDTEREHQKSAIDGSGVISTLTINVPPDNTEKDVAFGVKLPVHYWN